MYDGILIRLPGLASLDEDAIASFFA